MMMTHDVASLRPFLICKSGVKSCGFPLGDVIETMRGLPIEAFPDMPSFVSGVAIIRGETVPVVNLAALLGETDTTVTRFVTIRLHKHLVAFAVGGVVGVGRLTRGATEDLPPLLGDVCASIVSAISIRDAGLFSVLETSRIIPESVWKNLDARGILS